MSIFYAITHAGRRLGYIESADADSARVRASRQYGVAPGLIQIQGPCMGGALMDDEIPDWAAASIRSDPAAWSSKA